MMTKRGGFAARVVAMVAMALAMVIVSGAVCAQTFEPAGPGPVFGPSLGLGGVRIEARFVERTGGQEAGWGATGQILVVPQPSDPELLRWRQTRAVAISLARQNVIVPRGGSGLIRVGRDIPFAGWFLRHGVRAGWLEAGTEWREVESALDIEAWSLGLDGSVHLALVPEFSYLSGRSRRSVAFPDARIEIAVIPGVESRFAPSPALEAFYGRLLAGYDPLRRVWPVDLILRIDLLD